KECDWSSDVCSSDLSFAEQTLPPGERERVMESFERVLMPGLEKNQIGRAHV
ncbi:MbkA, partial [Escherichia coli SHECO001]